MSDKAEVAVSYDVDNDFFRLWLDRRMNYTGAVFEDTDDLEAAQLAKLAVLYRFGRVSESSRVLDIGCGWGANLEYLAVDRGVREVHGITLSEAQYAEILRRRLPGVTAACADYRDYIPQARFDTIMSICMIEHVCTPGQARAGEAVGRYRDFFRRAWEWSRPGAHFALQCILRNRAPRQAADIREVGWVTYEIFPGGITPRMEDIVMAVSPYWEILEVRTRREDYRRTCEHWRSRLRDHERQIRRRWGDRLYLDYERYLTACIRAFEMHYQSMAQWSLRRIDEILGSAMTTQELLALVAGGIAHVTGRPAPALTLDSDIAALGMDSLQTLELVAWAEEQLSVRVPDEELARLTSIGELSAVLAARLPAGAA